MRQCLCECKQNGGTACFWWPKRYSQLWVVASTHPRGCQSDYNSTSHSILRLPADCPRCSSPAGPIFHKFLFVISPCELEALVGGTHNATTLTSCLWWERRSRQLKNVQQRPVHGAALIGAGLPVRPRSCGFRSNCRNGGGPFAQLPHPFVELPSRLLIFYHV